MTSHKRISLSGDTSRRLVEGIAMDIGKEVVCHIENMYPQAISACSLSFKDSVRNKIYNEIIAALEVTNEAEILARLQNRRTHRRALKKQMKIIRETDWDAFRNKRDEVDK